MDHDLDKLESSLSKNARMQVSACLAKCFTYISPIYSYAKMQPLPPLGLHPIHGDYAFYKMFLHFLTMLPQVSAFLQNVMFCSFFLRKRLLYFLCKNLFPKVAPSYP